MGGYAVLYRKAAGGDFVASGVYAGGQEDAIKALKLGGSCEVDLAWIITPLPPEKSPQCLNCGGLVHIMNGIQLFWCPVCEPDGFEIPT